MLSHHLKSALKDLRDLITISQKDIDDIQIAQHNNQFERMSMKEERLKSFESKKAMIDHEISKKMSANPDKDISELLNESEHKELENLKSELVNLREINQRYAKMLLSVGSFYNSLLEKVLPTEMQGYNKVASSDPTFLKVRV